MTMTDNIRSTDNIDDSELRTSLMVAGWNIELPAIKDEYGRILVGHRRLKIAQEEGITPVIKVVTFGDGDEADAARIQLAAVSNIGAVPMSAADRKRQAERMYDGGKGMTMEAISKVLGVNKSTISDDLKDIVVCTTMSKPDRGIDTMGRKKSSGRPKGSKASSKSSSKASKKAKAEPKSILDKPRAATTKKREEEMEALAQSGMSVKEIAATTGRDERNVAADLEHARLKREAIAEAQPDIDAKLLSMSAQEKLGVAIRQHQRKLDGLYEARVRAEIHRRMDEIILPHWKEQIEKSKELYARRRALMDKDTFNTIRRALHPDSRNAISDKKLGEAFNSFMGLEKYLLNEADSPTPFGDIPNSAAEWDAARRRTSADRKAKRSGNAPATRA
jgi:ParB-like chromosome segregation protein Spo0J